MAKATTAESKDKGLEADLLKAAGVAPQARDAAEIDQEKVKADAAKLAGEASKVNTNDIKGTEETTTATPQQGVQMHGTGLPPVATNEPAVSGLTNADKWDEAEKDAAIRDANQNKAALLSDPYRPPFEVPGYLLENPVATQEEIDEIAVFLMGLRARAQAPVKEEAANQPDSEADKREELEKIYGKGFITATKKGSHEHFYFTSLAWKNLGGANNTDGFRELVQTPPEVLKLKGGIK